MKVSGIWDQTLFLEKLMKNAGGRVGGDRDFGPLGPTGEYSYSCGPGLPSRLTQPHRGMVFLERCASQVLWPEELSSLEELGCKEIAEL